MVTPRRLFTDSRALGRLLTRITSTTVLLLAALGKHMSVATFGDYDDMPNFFTHEQKLKGVAVGKGGEECSCYDART